MKVLGDPDAVAIHLTLTPREFEALHSALAAATQFRPIPENRHEADALGRRLFGADYPEWRYVDSQPSNLDICRFLGLVPR